MERRQPGCAGLAWVPKRLGVYDGSAGECQTALGHLTAVCGVSGSVAPTGRVACDGGDVYRTGYQLGGGFRWPYSPNRDIIFELRYVGNVTAAAGRSLLAVSVGLRGR